MKSVIERLTNKSISKIGSNGVKAPSFKTGMPKPNKLKNKIKDIKNKFKY